MRKYPPPQLTILLFLLLFQFTEAFAQNRTLTGVVRDSVNQPLVAATVSVKGGKASAVTAADGSFSLSVPSGNITLEVSYVGFTPVTVKVSPDQTDISVVMSQGNNTISDVVVTALGIKKDERKLGYSVTTVNGNTLNKARETNVALSLSGQVAGLNVHGTSGGPGGTARILLRGMPSMNSGGSPLFVINGVPMDNSNRGSAGEWGGADAGDGIGNINPDDIETMTVLKGQAASALYGARASNGVILITTKSGAKGSPNIEYNLNYVTDQPVDYSDYQYVYGQGQNGEKPITAAAALNTNRLSWGAKLDGSQVIGFDGKNYTYSPVTNNFNNFYRTGYTLTNTLSVSGGGDNGTYRISASALGNDNVVINSGISRKTFNVNLSQNVTPKLNVSVIANYIDEQDRNRENLSDGPGNPNNFLFLATNVNENIFNPYVNPDGSELVFSDDNYVTNPWFVVNRWINNTGRKRLIGSLSAKYNFTDWIYGMVRLGYDHENDNYLAVTPTGTSYSYSPDGSSSGQLNNQSNAQTSELNVDGIIGVNHAINKDFSFNATLGANLRKDLFETIGVNGNYFVIPYLYTPSNVKTFNRSYDYSDREVHSAYYSVEFSYRQLLTLATTGRYDAYSTLYNSGIPQNERNIFTPSVSGSFVFSQLLHSNILNFGKLRASYAQTSGEPGLAYQTAVYYSVGNSINGTPTGNFSSTLPNLFLKPFTKTEIEVGADLKFFNNRLGADIAWYKQKTQNEIMNGSLSASSGYTSRVVANGSVQNQGIEVGLTGTPIRSRNFSWDITLNYTHVQNKILKTDEAGSNIGLGTYRPLNANTAFVVGLPGPQIMAHDYTYNDKGQIVVDANGLPVQGGLIPMGSVLPTDYGGLNNSFTYKNFNLSFLIDYNYGNNILSATSYYSIYRGLNKMTLDGRDGGITVDGVDASGNTNTETVNAQSYYQRLASISKVNVLNGDYVKFRQVTLGYTFTENMFKKVPVIRTLQVSLVGRNLFYLMKKSDNIDPEAGFNASINYAGIEGTSIPSTRTYGINVNIKFKN